MSHSKTELQQIILAGAERLLARADNSRSLGIEPIARRVQSTVEKYVLKNEPEPDSSVLHSFIDSLHADDLCLVLACEEGDQSAWNDLLEGYRATVRSASRTASSNDETAEDLAQSIWAELHGLKSREDGRPAGKLSYYSGAGSLGGWLRAVTGQLAIDRHRREARLIHTEEDGDFDRLARDVDNGPHVSSVLHTAASPEETLANNLASAAVTKALAQALTDLDDEDRLLMKLYYFDGLRLREAGAVLGVHEATASRRLARIHGEVRKRVEMLLVKEHGWTSDEATRSLSQVAENLQIEVQPLLAQKDSPETSQAGSETLAV